MHFEAEMYHAAAESFVRARLATVREHSPTIARVQMNLQVPSADTRPPSCATRVSPRGPSLAFRAIHLVLRLRRANRMCSSKVSGIENR